MFVVYWRTTLGFYNETIINDFELLSLTNDLLNKRAYNCQLTTCLVPKLSPVSGSVLIHSPHVFTIYHPRYRVRSPFPRQIGSAGRRRVAMELEGHQKLPLVLSPRPLFSLATTTLMQASVVGAWFLPISFHELNNEVEGWMSDSVMLCFVQGFEGPGKEPKLQTVKNKLLRKSRWVSTFTWCWKLCQRFIEENS